MDDFLMNGYFCVRNAFPPEVASKCRDVLWAKIENESNIKRNDPSTWVKKHTMAEVYGFDDEPWSHVYSEKVKESIDQIIGPNNSESFGCGWWTLLFPGFEKNDDFSNNEWRVDGTWHIDGHIHKHFTYSKEIGLVAIMLFSDVLPDGGGTAIAEGSHLVAAKVLTESGLKGMTSKDLAHAVLNTQKSFNIIELTGQAGDIIFMHPLLLHARSTNLSKVHENGIRIMCHPAIPMKKSMNFCQPFEKLSLLEKSMVCGAMNVHTNFKLILYDIHDIVRIHQTYHHHHHHHHDMKLQSQSSVESSSSSSSSSSQSSVESSSSSSSSSVKSSSSSSSSSLESSSSSSSSVESSSSSSSSSNPISTTEIIDTSKNTDHHHHQFIPSHSLPFTTYYTNSDVISLSELHHLKSIIEATMVTLNGITPDKCLQFQQRKQYNRNFSTCRKRYRNFDEGYDDYHNDIHDEDEYENMIAQS